MLAPGYFIAGSHAIRGGTLGGWKWQSLAHGVLLFFPMLAIGILYGLLVAVGLVLFIIPGLYFLIAYSFSACIYIEYRQEGLGIVDAMSVSRKVLSKNFWAITGFIIFQFLLILAGALCLLIGVLVALPVASLMTVFAFRDIFGFSDKRILDQTCVCC